MAEWWEIILTVLLTELAKIGYILSVEFLNLAVLWELLPIYTSWFAVEFITKNKEEQDVSNRFMNSFSTLWVVFSLGTYIIENITRDAYIIIKIIAVVGVAAYAIFLMRLVFLRKSITKTLARVGEISSINIALMLLVQNQIIINNVADLIYTAIAFVLIYVLFDFVIIKLAIEKIYQKIRMPEEEEEAKETKPPEELKLPLPEIPASSITTPPRYERITKPSPPRTMTPIPSQPSASIGRPVSPPVMNHQATNTQATIPPITQAPVMPAAKQPIIKKPQA